MRIALRSGAGRARGRRPRRRERAAGAIAVLLAFIPARDATSGLLERLERDWARGGRDEPDGRRLRPDADVPRHRPGRARLRRASTTTRLAATCACARTAGSPAGGAAVERAEDAPGDVVPGPARRDRRRAGGARPTPASAGLTQTRRPSPPTAPAASTRVSLGPRGHVRATRLARLVREHDAASWPRFPAASRPGAARPALADRRDLHHRRARAARGRCALLPTAAIAAPSGDGLLTSRTTRRDGHGRRHRLRADGAATARASTCPTRWTGADHRDARRGPGEDAAVARRPPRARQGRARPARFGWRSRGWLVAPGRRSPLAGRGRAAGCALGLLAAMWLPGVALVTAALDPSRHGRGAPAGRRLARPRRSPPTGSSAWPRAPAVPRRGRARRRTRSTSLAARR